MEDKKYGDRLRKGVSEKSGIQKPFAEMITNGLVDEWEGSAIFESVKVGLNGDDEMTQKTDLVLIHPTGRIGIVECKRIRSNQAVSNNRTGTKYSSGGSLSISS
jgi:hypothetical protein